MRSAGVAGVKRLSDLPVTSAGDHAHAHPQRTGHRLVDLVIALSAITISVISLVVAIGHGKTEERLVAANSLPFLIFKGERQGSVAAKGDVFNLTIENPGVGPANVKSLIVRIDGKIVTDRQALMERCCGYKSVGFMGDVKNGFSTNNEAVGIIPARDGRTLLQWQETLDNGELFNRFVGINDHLSLSGCFCSVLNQCWQTDLKSTTTPRPVKACPIDRRTYRG